MKREKHVCKKKILYLCCIKDEVSKKGYEEGTSVFIVRRWVGA